jgi:ATP-dependent Clp protease protease subunit
METINNRAFYLTGEIDEKTIKDINVQLLKLIKEDNKQEQTLKEYKREPIELYINSFGGSVYDALSLIDIVIHSATPIYTICTGYAMSAGFLIFICGAKRFMTPRATLMIHQISGGFKGKIGDIEVGLEEYQRVETIINNLIFERTKVTPKMMEKNRKQKEDWFLNTTEAIKLCCCDEEILKI